MNESTRRTSLSQPLVDGQPTPDFGDVREGGGSADSPATGFNHDANNPPVAGKPADSLADFAVVEPPHAAGIPDPESELKAYRIAPRVEVQSKRPIRITALQIRKPNDQEYVRVMRGAERIVYLFKSKANGDKLYLFKPEVEPFLPAKSIRPYRLVLAKSLRAMAPFIWPLPVPQDDMGCSWHESGDQAARDAESQWVKVMPDLIGGIYVSYPAAAELPAPEWPSEHLEDLILLAFKNQRIDKEDHPEVLRLQGRVV
jgi:hypothetical protein